MAGEDYQSWSTTALNNGNADSLINWVEGQPRASVNDSSRSMMAAHAKNRNLMCGTITTGGTANAQTFASGVGYLSMPPALRALLKIGPGPNTGPATLNMDGIAAYSMVNQIGTSLLGGELGANAYVEVLFTGSNWVVLNTFGANGVLALNAGYLQLNSSTQLLFVPRNGDRIRIGGSVYAIPTAGIIIPTTGVSINTVAGQNLAANTTYLICLTAGTPPVVAFGTGLAHQASVSAGNVGTEIANALGDGYSVIGMCRTNASAQFQDSGANVGVISWFNRALKAFTAAINVPGIGAAPWQDLGTYATFLTWAGNAISASTGSAAVSGNGGNLAYLDLGFDSGSPAFGGANGVLPPPGPAGSSTSLSCGGSLVLAEGYHAVHLLVGQYGSGVNLFGFLSGTVFG